MVFMNNQAVSRENYLLLACSGSGSEDNLYILPLSSDAFTDKPIQLLPYGNVKSKKGDMLVDETAIKLIMESFAKEKNDAVVDYEHQTLKDVIAPAAGWIKELLDKGREGLWAVVDWTAKAKGFIENKEYRYISPVVFVRQSDRRPILFHSAGLTNTPAIDGMEPIACKLGSQAPKEENGMEFLKKLAALLGLPETATEEEITAAVNKLLQSGQIVANKEILTLLGLSEGAKLDETKGAIIALKNPSGYVKVEEFKILQDKLATRDRDELVQTALKSGKVAPAQKAWAEEYALKDPAGFKAFVEVAPVVVPVGQEVAGGADTKPLVTDETQLSINKSLGISDEDYKKYGGN